jgi:hypothetical protein
MIAAGREAVQTLLTIFGHKMAPGQAWTRSDMRRCSLNSLPDPTKPPSPSRSRRLRYLAVAVTALFGAVASIGVFLMIASWECRVAQIGFENLARDRLRIMDSDFKDSSALLYNLRAYIASATTRSAVRNSSASRPTCITRSPACATPAGHLVSRRRSVRTSNERCGPPECQASRSPNPMAKAR